jgi:hypothetical protein
VKQRIISSPVKQDLQHDPEKWIPVFPATNATRLRADHAQTISQSAMTIHPDFIAL